IVANHTENHVDLTTAAPGTIVREVSSTDAEIAPFVAEDRFLFRPPYGAWNADVEATLAKTSMKKYIGPILWDIGDRIGSGQAGVGACWQLWMAVETWADLSPDEIGHKDHGIVLLHDPYFIGSDPEKGGTVDMVKYIVPILWDEGYSFVRVDEVPSIAADLS